MFFPDQRSVLTRKTNEEFPRSIIVPSDNDQTDIAVELKLIFVHTERKTIVLTTSILSSVMKHVSVSFKTIDFCKPRANKRF